MNTEKFKNKFRIQSNRLSNFDYSSSGAYFVTICANNRENVFGEIVNGEIILNDIGQIVEEEILATEKIRKNVIIDEFVIMPNHVHVIIFLNNEEDYYPVSVETHMPVVETHCNASLQQPQSGQQFGLKGQSSIYKNKVGPQKNNVCSIIRGLKGGITNRINSKYCVKTNCFSPIITADTIATVETHCNASLQPQPSLQPFSWQQNYHDRIIRNEQELFKIRKYISENPQKWELDKNFLEN
ncbi:MAG: hypothetical protein PHF26_00535 [Candidatus Gracilibacteria bacterium]|nr:hypothetical protein [Candidatus Gracilibacteria bacterium]